MSVHEDARDGRSPERKRAISIEWEGMVEGMGWQDGMGWDGMAADCMRVTRIDSQATVRGGVPEPGHQNKYWYPILPTYAPWKLKTY